MATKPKKETHLTPKGTLKWPKLTDPDYGNEDFPKPDGEYNTKFILSAADAAIVRKKLGPIHAAAIEAGKKAFAEKPKAKREKSPFTEHPLMSPVYDEDENETGEFEMNFKSKASGFNKKTEKKWERKVPVFDAALKPMRDIQISGGTVAKISFSAEPFFMDANNMAGLSLRLEGVQVFDLVQGGERSGSSLGFSAEEGYTADEPDTSDFEVEDEAGGDDASEEEADF